MYSASIYFYSKGSEKKSKNNSTTFTSVETLVETHFFKWYLLSVKVQLRLFELKKEKYKEKDSDLT